jgi:peptidoglycan/LPS O-acetylase OafA/YrhL
MSSLSYRPALDGLRALAVAAVLVFHLDRSWLPGGFVGVDVFFVLSGYLLTSILLAEALQGRLSYAKFYQRRIARIAPASFCVIAATLVTAILIYNSMDAASTGAVAVSAALSAANMKLMFQGNYFEGLADAQPLLHFWSLGVEEQFYFLLPALLHVCVRLDRRLRVLTATLVVLLVLSFVACIVLTYTRPTWAFYLLPTRAWELIAGCLLAISATKSLASPHKEARSWGSVPGLLGLGLLAASFIFLHEGKGFPGYVAAIPVLGTMLCIGRRYSTDSVAERALAHPAPVFIGKISYSLYLWHWPVYSFVDYGLYEWGSPMRIAIKVGLSTLLAATSYFAIEAPARKSLNQPANHRLAYGLFLAMVIGGVLTGLAVRREFYVNANPSQVRGGGIFYPAAPQAPKVALVGDSNGSMYGRTLRNLCAERGWNLNVLSVAAGEPFAATPLHADTIAAIRQLQPDVVVIGAGWSGKLDKDERQIDRFVNELLEMTDGVVLLTQPPILESNTLREAIRQGRKAPFFEEEARAELRAHVNDLVRSLADSDERIALIDVEVLFTLQPGVVRFTDDDDRQLWQDATHLSGVGADLVEESLSDVIQRFLDRASQTE